MIELLGSIMLFGLASIAGASLFARRLVTPAILYLRPLRALRLSGSSRKDD